MNEFSEKLKVLRIATGMSQQALADRMQIPKRTLQSWEIGDRSAPPYVQRFVINELQSIVDEISKK